MSLMKGVVETASPVQVEMQDVANPVSVAPQAVATNRRTIGGAVVNSDMVPEKPPNTVKRGPYNMHNAAILGREVPLSSHFAPGEATLQSIKAVVEQPWLRAHGCCSGLKPPKDDGAMELMEVTLSLTSHRIVCAGDFSGGTFGVRNGAHGEVPLPRRNFLQQFALSDLVASQITYQGSQGPPGCCAMRRVAQGAVLRLWFFDFPESSSMVTDGIGAGSMSSAVQFSSSRDISALAKEALAMAFQVAGVHSTADEVANAAAEVAARLSAPWLQYLNRGGPRIELDDKCITIHFTGTKDGSWTVEQVTAFHGAIVAAKAALAAAASGGSAAQQAAFVRQQSGREALFVEVDDGFGSQVRNVEGTAKDGRVRVCKDILGFAPGEQTLNAMNTSPVMGCGVWISLVLHLIFGLVVFGLCRWYARVYKPFFQTASVVVMTDQRLIMHTVEATDGNAPLKGQRYVSHIIRCCFDIVPEATILQYEATAGGCCSGGGMGDGSIVCVVKGGTLTISSHLCTQPVDQILEPWFALSGGGDDGGASKSAAQADPVDADVVDEFSSVLGLNETLEAAVVASKVLPRDPTDELSCRALRKCRCTKRKNLTVTRAYAVSAHKLFLSSTWTASNSKSSFTSKVVYNLPVRSQSLGAVETVAARPSSMLDVVYPVPHLWCCGITPPACCSGDPVGTELGLPGLKLEWHGGGEANSHEIDMVPLNPRADDVKRFVSALMKNAGQSVV